MVPRRRQTPQGIASLIVSSLAIRGLGPTDPHKELASRKIGHRKGHRVNEWVIEIAQPGTKPILVIVRIADTRPSTVTAQLQAQGIADEPSNDAASFHFDQSGLPIYD
jgi:hypothetical protein